MHRHYHSSGQRLPNIGQNWRICPWDNQLGLKQAIPTGSHEDSLGPKLGGQRMAFPWSHLRNKWKKREEEGALRISPLRS